MVTPGLGAHIENPAYPYNDTARLKDVGTYLVSRNFLLPGESVVRLVPVRPKSRNSTLCVETSERSFVLKHFRPWSNLGRNAPLPEHRFRAECQFYRAAQIGGGVGRTLPALLHQDSRAACVILEAVGEEPVALRNPSAVDAEALAWFLVALHHHSQSVPAAARYRNAEVLGWRMTNLFRRTLRRPKGGGESWLADLAGSSTAVRSALDDALAALEHGGRSLVHGEFAPKNWVRDLEGGPRVVDGEFSFFGPPEFDVGAFIAGLTQVRTDSSVMRAGVSVVAGCCLRYCPRLAAAFAAVHLCASLQETSGRLSSAPRPRFAATVRRIVSCIENGSFEPFLQGPHIKHPASAA